MPSSARLHLRTPAWMQMFLTTLVVAKSNNSSRRRPVTVVSTPRTIPTRPLYCIGLLPTCPVFGARLLASKRLDSTHRIRTRYPSTTTGLDPAIMRLIKGWERRRESLNSQTLQAGVCASPRQYLTLLQLSHSSEITGDLPVPTMYLLWIVVHQTGPSS